MTTKKTIAVFDFDGTLTKKDTLLQFIKFSKGKRQFYIGFLLFSPLIVAMKLKLYPNWKTKQKLFSYFFRGVSLEKFNDWGDKFSIEIDKIIRPKALEALNQHKKNGDIIIIISASVENWIKPWAKRNEFITVLATKLEYDSNKLLTGTFKSKNCYGKEKVNRLLELYPNKKNYVLFAYGDSRGDKEIIELADYGFYNKFK